MLSKVFYKEALCGHVSGGKDCARSNMAHVISVWWTDAANLFERLTEESLWRAKSPRSHYWKCQAGKEVGQIVPRALQDYIIGSFWPLSFNDHFNFPSSVWAICYMCISGTFADQKAFFFTSSSLICCKNNNNNDNDSPFGLHLGPVL